MELKQFVATNLLYLRGFISTFLKRPKTRTLSLGEVLMTFSTQSSLI